MQDLTIVILIANRHIAHCGCFDNVLCFIKKNSGEAHPFYIILCQYRQLDKRNIPYPNMEVADEWDDQSTIHRWCRFKREVIKKRNYWKNHFSLTEEERAFLETALDVNI